MSTGKRRQKAESKTLCYDIREERNRREGKHKKDVGYNQEWMERS